MFDTEVDLKSINKNDLLSLYRNTKDSQIDKNTYDLLDSIAKNSNFNKLMNITTSLMNGFIPLSIFNLPLSDILQYNVFENWRLGLGFVTNDKLSERFILDCSMGYGLGDKNGNIVLQV